MLSNKFFQMKLFVILLVCLFMVSAASARRAVREAINLSGTLVDQNNAALSGTYEYLVRFYDDAVAGNQLGNDVTGSVDVSLEGVFNINVVPATTVLYADAAWYELAIDADQNGLDAGDVFGQRTAMHSVPYALMAQSASTLADADLLAATTIVAASASIGNASLTGNLHVDGVITGTYQGTIANADNASALGGTPAADWASDAELATGLATKADASHTHNLQDLSGAVTDAQVPDDITITEADTLDSVTSRGSMTNNGITVDTLSTGQGANELYAMDQNVRTTDGVVFQTIQAVTATLGAGDVVVTGDSRMGVANPSPGGSLEVEGSAAIDQENSPADAANSINFGQSEDLWQSFTAGTSGNLTAIAVRHVGSSQVRTVQILDGEGLGGAELATVSDFDFAGAGWVQVNLATPVWVTEGQKYTIVIQQSNGFALYLSWYTPRYLAGQFGVGASLYGETDMHFRTYVQEDPSLFVNNGQVGIGNRDPEELLDVEGALRLRDAVVPATTTARLYNNGGNLFWNGSQLDAAATNWTLDLVTDEGASTTNSISVGAVTAPTINTGQGANELYAMDQDVQTTDDVTFNQVSANAFYGDGSGLTGIAGGLPTSGDQYVFPDLTTGMTDTQRGTALLGAVTAAKALGPAADNRVTVLVPPGDYDLGGESIELTSAYLDLVGLSDNREAQYIYSGGVQSGSGVIYQTADHVYIANLVVECTNSSGSVSMNDPAAYYPNVSWQDSGTQIGSSANTEINNCEFIGDESNQSWSMRLQSDYAGTYEDCTAGKYAFGTTGGDASGTFINCTAGDFSFGSGSDATGTFIDCTAGSYSFAGTVSSGGEASGTFTRCTAGMESFANEGTASGTFTDCTAGNRSFGGSGTASGTFTRCTGEDYCFGDDAASGKFYDCTAGYLSFGGYGDEASGEFHNCTGGQYAFSSGAGGTASGQFYNCTGGNQSFGGAGGTASGTFDNCTGGGEAFGGGGTASGTFDDCTGDLAAFGGNGGTTAGGIFTNCTGGHAAFGGGDDGTASGTFYNCTGGNSSFGGNTTGGKSGTASGTFDNCTGGDNAFGGEGGTASGFFNNCTGGDQSFGGGDGTASGVFRYCVTAFYGFGGGSSGTGSAAGGNFYFCEGESDAFTTNGSPTVINCIRGATAYP